jgi:hypothetical protein
MTELATTPTTVLEAINQMLFVIGEPPVNSVEDNGVIFAVTALQTLSQVNRAVQMRGWHWNTEENYPLTPTYPEGFINLPKNTLKVDTTGPDAQVDAISKGNRLYDRKKHTFVFGRTVYVNIVLLHDFEELPEAARHYITVRAARQFQEGAVGSEQLSGFTARDELLAKLELEDAEAETLDLNILDNVFVAEVMRR